MTYEYYSNIIYYIYLSIYFHIYIYLMFLTILWQLYYKISEPIITLYIDKFPIYVD